MKSAKLDSGDSQADLLRIAVGQCCVAGVKEENEDCTGVRIPDDVSVKGVAAAVADGVSAANGGKVAGETCVQSFLADYFSTPDSWTVKTSGQRVLDSLNRWLYGQGHAEGLSDEKGYVSTLSAMVLRSQTAYIFHVGDSRIYRVRGREVEQLTRDHRSFVSRDTNYLNRAMGLNLNLKVDYREVDVEVGDVYLLCTDGLHDWLRDEVMLAVLSRTDDLDAAAVELVEIALKAGSDDNVTCLVLRIDGLPSRDLGEAQRLLKERPFPPLLAPGMKLDGLEVEEVLIESSRSQLYRVTDQLTGEEMVMKTPSPNFRDDPGYIERFAAEEWIGKRLNHKNLVKVIERERKPTFLYYLMEPLKGKNLAQWLKSRDGRPSVEEVVKIVEQIVSGVRALHRKETLHQDLKLENIVVNEAGEVKVIDYGSCRIAGLREPHLAGDVDHVGTLEFAAPEYRLPMVDGVGSRADLFSIAMVAYHLLSGGKCPYGEKWENAQSTRDFNELKYDTVCRHHPMVPVWIDGALEKALRLKPSDRYANMSEWVHDLKYPNPAYQAIRYQPLLERDPLLFWKCLSGLLFVIVLVFIYLLQTS